MFAIHLSLPIIRRYVVMVALSLSALSIPAAAQTEVTGAFRGVVQDGQTRTPIANAIVRYINQDTQVAVTSRSNTNGEFSKFNLTPGRFTIEISAPNYKVARRVMTMETMKAITVLPDPVTLEPEPALPVAGPVNVPTTVPVAPALPSNVTPILDSIDVPAELNATDARRGGTYTGDEVATLPLGGITLTRSFDELALLLPGVALPPQTQSGVAGPGVGPGVGSAGQFAVNGLRSRGNNFTVDGSDNNDEDIGVRRQGFFTLVPQSIESIQEYQITTALAPAQYGRNLGALVNVNSKSGGYQTHGTFYGFLNTSQLNARDLFDTTSNGQPFQLQGLGRDGIARNVFLNDVDFTNPDRPVIKSRTPFMVKNPAAGKDSLTFGQAGFSLGGPLLPQAPAGIIARKSAFYFFSFEGQLLNANKEKNFAVPTVGDRGLFGNGATGVSNFIPLGERPLPVGSPANIDGNAIFSLFPLPNNPGGVYGARTYTQILPASAQGNVASFKLEHNFKVKERDQAITGRYNRTQDWRNIPATGGALFSTLRPVVNTHNFSLFLNSQVTANDALRPVQNQLRISYGRTRLLFEEERDNENLLPSEGLPKEAFLLNAPFLFNATFPGIGNAVEYVRTSASGKTATAEGSSNIGPVGQVILAGFSPLGVDVFNFPQRRANNTYQIADTLSVQVNNHALTFGGDFRRTDLNSDLPRNARTLLSFGSSPAVGIDFSTFKAITNSQGRVPYIGLIDPLTLAAAGAPNNVTQTVALQTSNIGLRYYQLNGFAQDEWRIRPNLSLSYGVRYEYNTPPREVNNLIEKTFNAKELDLLPSFRSYLKNRTRIFDPDYNNVGPRVGLAYAHNIWGTKATVFRAGYGLFYDQIVGAVVSQSRNVFPNFLTLNSGGGFGVQSVTDGRGAGFFGIFNLGAGGGRNFNGTIVPVVKPGTLNQFNQAEFDRYTNGNGLKDLVESFSKSFSNEFGFTLPDRNLPTPKAHQYSFTIEQELGKGWTATAAYVGTLGRNLLRLTTPNLGPNLFLPTVGYGLSSFTVPGLLTTGLPQLIGYRATPNQQLRPLATQNNCAPLGSAFCLNIDPTTGRPTKVTDPATGQPTNAAGAIYIYQTNAESRYDSLQLQLSGRFRNRLQTRLSYTFAKVLDDVSDVFDLAGAAALPQKSCILNDTNCNYDNERGPANFDVRHRFTANVIYSFASLSNRHRVTRAFFGGYQLASTWQYQTGQPFTVNSLYDINLDGNYTDRLNTTQGLTINEGNNRQPLSVALNTADANEAQRRGLLAGFFQDGRVGRNTFRAGDFLIANLAVLKKFALTERQALNFRAEFFNLGNRSNFGVPIRLLEAPGFGQAVDTVTPGRRIQFALKYSF